MRRNTNTNQDVPENDPRTGRSLTGQAGLYYVAFQLNALGYQCAPTLGNAPGIDLYASKGSGEAPLALQVKTAHPARRLAGDGSILRYEWSLGEKAMTLAQDGKIWFALVDIFEAHQPGSPHEIPPADVFVVPPSFVARYYENRTAHYEQIQKEWKWKRMHIDRMKDPGLFEELESYRNDWGPALADA